jgi:hypothetical protein
MVGAHAPLKCPNCGALNAHSWKTFAIAATVLISGVTFSFWAGTQFASGLMTLIGLIATWLITLGIQFRIPLAPISANSVRWHGWVFFLFVIAFILLMLLLALNTIRAMYFP